MNVVLENLMKKVAARRHNAEEDYKDTGCRERADYLEGLIDAYWIVENLIKKTIESVRKVQE